jgi:hypothetical protein
MQKIKFLVSSVLVAALLLLSGPVQAKNLVHRLGVGLKNNTSENLPSLAAVYYASQDYAFTGGVGVDTKSGYSAMQIHAGIRKMVYFENNLNFFVGAQAGLLSYENPIDGKNNGLDIMATFGSEFFFTGLENLGFTFEAGLDMTTAKGTRIRTVADDPFRAGIIFYF